MFPRSKNLVVDKGTHLVIEGFPRSANTFAVVAFNYAQNRPLKIARHQHAPAQIIQAASWKIPTIVFIRNPKDAEISLLIREPFRNLRQTLRYCINFYGSLINYRSGFVLAPFDTVINNFGGNIDKINTRFKAKFKSFEHTSQNLDAVFNNVEQMDMVDRKETSVMEQTVARPSKKRENQKIKLICQLDTPNIYSVYREALDVYNFFLSDLDQ